MSHSSFIPLKQNFYIQQSNNNSPEAYHTLFRETIPDAAGDGGAINTRPLYLNKGDTDDDIFPHSQTVIDRMMTDQVTNFAVWYGIYGEAIPTGGNVQQQRTAVRRFVCGL